MLVHMLMAICISATIIMVAGIGYGWLAYRNEQQQKAEEELIRRGG